MFQKGNLIWLALFGASIGWLVWPRDILRDGQHLAVVTAVEGDVKLRTAGSFNWVSVRPGTKLFAMDAISTGGKSSTKFDLLDKTRIRVPEDTQLKIQKLALNKGISIALAQGGISVVSNDDDQQRRNRSKGGLVESLPLMIKKAVYDFNLSQLSGSFDLESGKLTASNPSDITIMSANGTMNLTQFKKSVPVVQNNEARYSVVEIAMPTPTPEPPPPPKPKPVAMLRARPAPAKPPEPVVKAAPPPAPKIALVPEKEPSYPVLQLGPRDFYWTRLLSANVASPLIIRATDAREADDPWKPFLKVSVKGSAPSVSLRRMDPERGFIVTLPALQSLLPAEPFRDISLILEPGVFREGDSGKELRLAGKREEIRLHGLTSTDKQTIQLDRIRLVEADGSWFAAGNQGAFAISLHVWDPGLFSSLEGFLRGAELLRIQALDAKANASPVHFIKGAQIVLSVSSKDLAAIESLQSKIQADLVFSGPQSAYVGGRGSFDFATQFDQYPQLYYARRNKALGIDKNLMSTQPAARKFIIRIDPYFFKDSVEILHNISDSSGKAK